ncbi:response regulator [Leptolyngbya sp. FACHB-711]|uniref:response regulator n=1 Tax=unclassified Leptolyngbya TaxID=2650499 RepID=UPI0016864CFA|nr:response regulator [Cyanobacteria bacterium FACHB-502]MBD2027894.1 response regulator [Leptolyngbya sp. FACHB-711]
MEKLSLGQFLVHVKSIKNSQLTGTYTLQSNANQSWKLVFRLGRIAWGGGGEHRFRRWYRCIKHYCPELDPGGIRLRQQDIVSDWEYTAIALLMMRQQISRDQGIAMIQQVVIEVLFDLVQSFEVNSSLMGHFEPQADVGEPPVLLDSEQAVARSQYLWGNWFNAGLTSISPNLAPVLKNANALEKQLSGNSYSSLKSLVNGNSSLRDLAFQIKQDVLAVARSFSPYFQQGLMGLQTIADLPAPPYQLTELKVKVAEHQPLIVCIDDSVKVCETMSEIITQAGYRFIAIHDSFQALPTLLAQKPSFIFLDLVMPIASGYEICTQIRRVSSFKDIPIVILTGNDGIIDRVRARVVGASDFLSKPIESDKVIAVINRHLRNRTAGSANRSLENRSIVSPEFSTDSFIV